MANALLRQLYLSEIDHAFYHAEEANLLAQTSRTAEEDAWLVAVQAQLAHDDQVAAVWLATLRGASILEDLTARHNLLALAYAAATARIDALNADMPEDPDMQIAVRAQVAEWQWRQQLIADLDAGGPTWPL